MKYRTALIIVAAGFALFVGSLFVRGADTYNIELRTWFDLPQLSGGTASVKIDGGGYTTVYAGQFDAKFIGDSPAGHPTEWVTFCTDFKNILAGGMFTARSLTVAASHPEWQNPDWVSGGIQKAMQLYLTYGPSVDTAAEAVAMQVGIWEFLYDAHPSLSDGAFQMQNAGSTPGAYDIAQAWIAASTSPLSGYEVWWEPSSAGGSYRSGQGLLGRAEVVPEPPTAVLMLTMTGLLVWQCRKTLLRV